MICSHFISVKLSWSKDQVRFRISGCQSLVHLYFNPSVIKKFLMLYSRWLIQAHVII